jgi:hypothetical protein
MLPRRARVRLGEGKRQAGDPACRAESWRAGFSIVATGGTSAIWRTGYPVERSTRWPQGRPHIVDKITDGEIALIFNTTEGWQSLKDSAIDPRFGAEDRKFPTSPRRRLASPRWRRSRL